jgi:hypothetical protein
VMPTTARTVSRMNVLMSQRVMMTVFAPRRSVSPGLPERVCFYPIGGV